jgi:hypothetical protein
MRRRSDEHIHMRQACSGRFKSIQGGGKRCRQLLAVRNPNENIRQIRNAFITAIIQDVYFAR